MITVTFTAAQTDHEPLVVVGSGETLGSALLDLAGELHDILELLEIPDFWQAAAELTTGNADREYISVDFSNPENNFTLTVEES